MVLNAARLAGLLAGISLIATLAAAQQTAPDAPDARTQLIQELNDRASQQLAARSRAVVSYRSIVDDPLPKDIAGGEIHGVLLHYDVPDLLLALAPRPVTVIDPIVAAGNPVSEADFHCAMGRVFASDSALHRAGRVRLQ